MESFWSTLKMERISRTKLTDAQSVRRAAFEYIEGFYNPRRRHSSIGYLSPLDFEALST